MGREIGLKQQLLEDAVVVDVHGLHRQILVGTIGAHVDLAHIVHRQQGAQLTGIERDSLARTSDIDGVADRDGGAWRAGQRRGEGGEEDEE